MNRTMQGTIILIVPICLLVAFTSCRPSPTPALRPEAVQMWIIPPQTGVHKGEQFEVKVEVNPNGKGISAGEVILSYSTRAIEVVSLEPGNLLGPNPIEGVRFIDNEKGRICFALGRQGVTHPPTKQGTFVVLVLRIRDSGNEGSYAVNIIGASLVNEQFEDISPLKITGGNVEIIISKERLCEQ